MERLNAKSAAELWARVNHISIYQAKEEVYHFQNFFRTVLEDTIPWHMHGLFDLRFTVLKPHDRYNVTNGEMKHYPPVCKPRIRFSDNILEAVSRRTDIKEE